MAGTNSPAAKIVTTLATAPAATPPTTTVPQAQAAAGNSITAPMPGAVLEIVVSEGQDVQAGEVVLILEAMKMENEITAPAAGKIKKIVTSKGAAVNTGDLLLVIE